MNKVFIKDTFSKLDTTLKDQQQDFRPGVRKSNLKLKSTNDPLSFITNADLKYTSEANSREIPREPSKKFEQTTDR